jgi:hypothetical protein
MVRIWPWLIAASCSACGHPKIARFDATPRHVCPGERVELAWEFSGSGTMIVTPSMANAPAGHVADRGTASIQPMAPTRIELRVTRMFGDPIGEQRDIEMAQGESVTASIADDSAACSAGVVSSTAHLRDFAPDLAVALVGMQPGDGRAGYDVTHVDARTRQPVTAHVAPAAPTDRFAGMPIAGDWVLSSALAAGESCDPPSLPNNLVVVAYTNCGDGGGQR